VYVPAGTRSRDVRVKVTPERVYISVLAPTTWYVASDSAGAAAGRAELHEGAHGATKDRLRVIALDRRFADGRRVTVEAVVDPEPGKEGEGEDVDWELCDGFEHDREQRRLVRVTLRKQAPSRIPGDSAAQPGSSTSAAEQTAEARRWVWARLFEADPVVSTLRLFQELAVSEA